MADRLSELRREYRELKQAYHERRAKLSAKEREELSAELDNVRRMIDAEEEATRG